MMLMKILLMMKFLMMIGISMLGNHENKGILLITLANHTRMLIFQEDVAILLTNREDPAGY